MKKHLIKVIVFCSLVAITLWTVLAFILASFILPHILFDPQDHIHISIITKSGHVEHTNWINQSDGSQLDDNFKDLPEIQKAFQGYFGHNMRYDNTLRDETDFFAFRLNGDEIVQLALNHEDALESLWVVILCFGLILIVVVLICYCASTLLTNRIISPLENIDLDNLSEQTIKENKVINSPEIRKFVNRIFDYNNERRQLIADLSHEYKTPLHIISSHLYILQNEAYKDQVDLKNRLQKIHAETTHMKNLLAIILDTERIYSKNTIDNYERIDVNLMIENIVAMQTEHTHIDISTTFQSKRAEIEANKVLIFDALRNVIDNATFYAASHINITTHEDKDHIFVRVGNDGSTITSEDRHNIFKRFYRATKSERNASNYGIGLAVVKKILNLHNGDVTLKSSHDNYTEFEIKIPKTKHEIPNKLVHNMVEWL